MFRTEWVTIALAGVVISLSIAGCGETDPSQANPKPEEKRAKYLDIHPPAPGKKPAKTGAPRR